MYLGIGCSLIAAWCWNKGLESVSASISGIFLVMEPVFGVIMAVILLQESSYVADIHRYRYGN